MNHDFPSVKVHKIFSQMFSCYSNNFKAVIIRLHGKHTHSSSAEVYSSTQKD